MSDVAHHSPPVGLGRPYERRHIRFIRHEDVDGWRLKLYGIALNGREPDPEFVEATRDLAASVLPRPAAGDDHYGVGFATAHDATSLYIALIYWWQSENELHQRIYVSPKDDPIAFTQVENQPTGCVWELAIVDFERRAWVEDVLAPSDGPHVERYLERRLDADV
ncbi:MAG: isochorismatase [Gaiellaceae bacterium]